SVFHSSQGVQDGVLVSSEWSMVSGLVRQHEFAFHSCAHRSEAAHVNRESSIVNREWVTAFERVPSSRDVQDGVLVSSEWSMVSGLVRQYEFAFHSCACSCMDEWRFLIKS
ncbi:MAG: hypothetical protein WA874_17220, partial [Chryseosolibacter sp.]